MAVLRALLFCIINCISARCWQVPPKLLSVPGVESLHHNSKPYLGRNHNYSRFQTAMRGNPILGSLMAIVTKIAVVVCTFAALTWRIYYLHSRSPLPNSNGATLFYNDMGHLDQSKKQLRHWCYRNHLDLWDLQYLRQFHRSYYTSLLPS